MTERHVRSRFTPAARRCAAGALALAFGSMASAQAPEAPAYAGDAARDSYYAAGERVDVPAPVNGDAVVAGRDVAVAHPVMGDILAVGASVTIAAPAGDDVRVAGRQVTMDALVDGDLTAAGGTLALGPNSRITGRTWLAGGDVRAGGTFEREVRIAATRVQIAGELRQPARVTAQQLEVLPGARILAPLVYEGPSPARVAAGATLSQPIDYRNVPAETGGGGGRAGSSLLFAIHVFVAGWLLLLLVPRLTVDPVRVLRTEPGLSLVAGFTFVALVPVAAVLLVVTLIGIPVGLALAATYFVALLIGLVVSASAVGRVEARYAGASTATRGQQALWLLAGTLTLAVVRIVPFIGTVIVLLAILYGVGALGVWLYRTYAPLRAVPAAG